MKLTDAQIESYRSDGYVIPDYRLSDDALAGIRGIHDRLIAAHPEFSDYCPNVLAYDLAFLNYARDPEILDMIEQVLGPDFALWNSSFFAKPAMNGRATPWHQDGEYWPIRPIATCTVWIAVDDSTTENGCLRVLRGSHKDRVLREHQTNSSPELTLNQELPRSEISEADIVDLELEAGQMSLHDVFIVHGSEPNRSARPRRGMTLRFMPTTSLFDRALAVEQTQAMDLAVCHEDRTLYLMRGIDRSGKNDFRMRR